MDRAMKWLKGLFSLNKKKNETSNSGFSDGGHEGVSSFGHSLRRVNSTGLICNPPTTPQNITPAEAAWLRNMSTLYGDDQEIYNQAMVVISATMAVVEATVKAEEAADELMRLTNRGRLISAVITIQTIFRGFLARKALKALKALVKLQARVRGFLVRKQIYVTFHRMMALRKAEQRAIKARLAQLQSKKPLDKFDNSERVFKGASRRSKSFSNVTDMDQCFKRLDVNLEKTASRSRKNKKCMNGFNGDETYSDATFSPPPGRNRARMLFAKQRSFDDSYQWGHVMRGDQNNYSAPLISPLFTESSGSNSPINQEKCEPENVYFRNGNENHPNSMVNRRYSNAKARSQSLLNQRGDEFSGSKRRASLSELTIESKSSCSRAQGYNTVQNIVMAKILKH